MRILRRLSEEELGVLSFETSKEADRFLLEVAIADEFTDYELVTDRTIAVPDRSLAWCVRRAREEGIELSEASENEPVVTEQASAIPSKPVWDKLLSELEHELAES